MNSTEKKNTKQNPALSMLLTDASKLISGINLHKTEEAHAYLQKLKHFLLLIEKESPCYPNNMSTTEEKFEWDNSRVFYFTGKY